MKKLSFLLFAILSTQCFAAPKKPIEPAFTCLDLAVVNSTHQEYISTERELIQLAIHTPWVTYKNIDTEWLILDLRMQNPAALPYAMIPKAQWANNCKIPTQEANHKIQVTEYMKQLINNINTVNELEPNIQKQANCATTEACYTALSQKFEILSLNAKKTLFTNIPNSSACFEHKKEILSSFSTVQQADNTVENLIKEKGYSDVRSMIVPPTVGVGAYPNSVLNYWKEHLNDPTLNTPLFLTSCADWQYWVNSNQLNLDIRTKAIETLNKPAQEKKEIRDDFLKSLEIEKKKIEAQRQQKLEATKQQAEQH